MASYGSSKPSQSQATGSTCTYEEMRKVFDPKIIAEYLLRESVTHTLDQGSVPFEWWGNNPGVEKIRSLNGIISKAMDIGRADGEDKSTADSIMSDKRVTEIMASVGDDGFWDAYKGYVNQTLGKENISADEELPEALQELVPSVFATSKEWQLWYTVRVDGTEAVSVTTIESAQRNLDKFKKEKPGLSSEFDALSKRLKEEVAGTLADQETTVLQKYQAFDRLWKTCYSNGYSLARGSDWPGSPKF